MSLGGWLRGTKALTALILQRYTAEGAEVLKQPALLNRFETQLAKMPPNATVSKMEEGVRKMGSLVATSDGPTSEKSVRDLGVLCDELLVLIDAKAAESRQ